MTVVEHNEVEYQEAPIIETSEAINLKDIDDIKELFEREKCVQNAKIVAEKLNCKCVEGFVFCMVVNGSEVNEKVIRHCWNKIDENHFDITKDFVWSEFGFPAEKFFYFPIDEFTFSDYTAKGQDLFISNAVEIASEINKKWKEEISKDK